MAEFGPIIDTYTMRDAVKDGAVLELVYEGRLIKPDMDEKGLDTWFERLTVGLSDAQKADLKLKYPRQYAWPAGKGCCLPGLRYLRAFSCQFSETGLKAQLVAPNKATALKYKAALDDIGHVSSEVLISSPDTREGHGALMRLSQLTRWCISGNR